MPLLYHLELSPLRLRLEEEGKKRILYLDTLKALAQTADQGPLSLLIDLHLKATRAPLDTLSFHTVELKGPQLLPLLKGIAATKRLFFERKKIAPEMKRGKLFWKGEPPSLFIPCLESEGTILPLETFTPLTPSCLLFHEQLVELTSPFPLPYLSLFAQGPCKLEGAQRKKFLDEEPQILWKQVPEAPPAEPLPELHLVDAHGCFANLHFSYPPNTLKTSPSLEQALEKDLLEAGFQRKFTDNSTYFCPTDQLLSTLTLLLEVGWRILDRSKREVTLLSPTHLSLRETSSLLSLEGTLAAGDTHVPLARALDALQQGKRWLDLDVKKVALLDPHRLPFHTSTLPREQLLELTPLLERTDVSWPEGLKETVQKLKRGDSDTPAPPSPHFRGTLLPYQQKGVDWLAFHHRSRFAALLADEMGLGKTVQVLAFFSQLRTNLPLLIVAPTSLLFHWEREIARFLPTLRVTLYAGADRKRENLAEAQCLLTSYALLRQEIDLFSSFTFEVILLDEAQAIKTASSQTAQAICRLKGNFRISLSGTPLENRPEELWSHFRFLLPPLLGDLATFQKTPLEKVRRKIAPFLLRRKKEEVALQLPEKIEQIVWVEMEPKQRALYESYRQQLEQGILQKVQKEGFAACRMEVLEAILRLRQISADPRLLDPEAEGGAKLAHLLEEVTLSLEEGRNVLIYSQFTQMLRLIEQELKEKNIPFLTLDGSTPLAARGPLVERFQKGEVPLFLLSLKAGGVGLNLTAADTVLLFDPWWNEAVERQAIDRAHRIGQKRGVLAKRYLTPHTVEEKMLSLKTAKGLLAEELLNTDSEPLSWREEDWLRLLT